MNVQINVSYSNSVYELKQEASKMKTIFILLLFFCNSLQAQPLKSNQTSENQLDYFKSIFKDLNKESGNNILSSNLIDSILFNGESSSNYFGFCVSSAGDVNGDGYSDIIIGAPGYNNNTGSAYIFYGGEIMNSIADVTLIGEAINNEFACVVSSAGDVNGDGYSDVIVSAPGYGNYLGKVYIYYGGVSMNNIADVTMTGQAILDEFGRYAVSSAGDVNDDGYSDVIIGAHNYSSASGRVYIFFGSSVMNNVADVTITGESAYISFGISAATAGDVNGDGYDDVIVGAHQYNNSAGKTYIYYGGNNMNIIADVTMNGEATGNYFGASVSTAGDANGDGFSDVIVGAFGRERAYIYYGGASMNNISDVIMNDISGGIYGIPVATAGDLNGDGFSDVIVCAKNYDSKGRAYIYYGNTLMDNVADIIKTGEATGNSFGNSASSAGDINGDGYSDVIIGAFGYNSIGRVYLYYNFVPKPELNYPNNNSINNPLIINFKWKKLVSSIHYVLNVSTDSTFNSIIVNDTISSDTSKTISGFLNGTKYFWRVIAIDNLGVTHTSAVWNFKTLLSLKINLKVLMEGMYFSIFNQLTRKDTVKVFIRNVTAPFSILDSAKGVIDSLSFSGLFVFKTAPSGTYYIVAKHLNSIETWSKSGGESIIVDGSIYEYDFTSSASKAYGNNLKFKNGKYCIYSGDLDQDGIVDASDLSIVDNDSYVGLSGRFLRSDVNGDGFIDASDITIVDNNRSVVINRPYF